MRKHIDKLRSKPEGHKRAVQFFSALAITLLISILWLTTFFYSSEGQYADNGSSPFSVIRDNATAAVEQARDGVVILKEQLKK